MTSQTRHLLTLWNPSYAANAMDEHLSVLLDWGERWRRGGRRRPILNGDGTA